MSPSYWDNGEIVKKVSYDINNKSREDNVRYNLGFLKSPPTLY